MSVSLGLRPPPSFVGRVRKEVRVPFVSIHLAEVVVWVFGHLCLPFWFSILDIPVPVRVDFPL